MYKILLFAVSLISLTSWAGPQFTLTKNDLTVPFNCRQMQIPHFREPIDFFAFSIEGGVGMGFDFEYPLGRDQVRWLWESINSKDPALKQKVKRNPDLWREYHRLENHRYERDFDFSKEGDVLELLVILQLRNTYSLKEYYITSAVEYGHQGGRALGELDVIVARKSNCQVVMLGETKIGVHRLAKARQQLRRIADFLDAYAGKGHKKWGWDWTNIDEVIGF